MRYANICTFAFTYLTPVNKLCLKRAHSLATVGTSRIAIPIARVPNQRITRKGSDRVLPTLPKSYSHIC